MTGSHFAAGDLLVVLAWGVGAAVIAYRRFTWLPGRGHGNPSTMSCSDSA